MNATVHTFLTIIALTFTASAASQLVIETTIATKGGKDIVSKPTVIVESGKPATISTGGEDTALEFALTPTLLDNGTVDIPTRITRRNGKKTDTLGTPRVIVQLGKVGRIEIGDLVLTVSPSLAGIRDIERETLLKQYETSFKELAEAERAVALATTPEQQAAASVTAAKHRKWIDELKGLIAKTEQANPGAEPTVQAESPAQKAIVDKLNAIRIPSIAFKDITIEEAIDFLRQRAKELDVNEPDPAKKGVSFMIRRPGSAAGEAAVVPSLAIKELRLSNVSLGEALRHICNLTKYRYKVDDFAVTLVLASESEQELFTRVFRLPPEFLTALAFGAGMAANPSAAPTAGGAATPNLVNSKSIKQLLIAAGITFADGCSATLVNSGSLVVTNTPSELEKVDELIQSVAKPDRKKNRTR